MVREKVSQFDMRLLREMGVVGLIAPEPRYGIFFCQGVLNAFLGVSSEIWECCRSFLFTVMYLNVVRKRFSSFYFLMNVDSYPQTLGQIQTNFCKFA